MRIALIDPALYRRDGTPSPNVGDHIISRAVHRELHALFGDRALITAVPSHQYPDRRTIDTLRQAELVFVGGSNLLYFRWWRRASWKLGPRGLLFYRDLILMGTGWGAYEIGAGRYARWVARRILSSRRVHSVRDSFTRNLVERQLGLPNVVNTACPSMWRLDADRIAALPRTRADACVFALTDYAKRPEDDRRLIGDLEQAYDGRLQLWPQGAGDTDYCRSLGYRGPVLERSLAALLALLESGARFDYVGTRLHAGILCLEHGVRSVIIDVDNRSREIAADTGLPTIPRGDPAALLRWLQDDLPIRIRLPTAAIASWRAQFRSVQ